MREICTSGLMRGSNGTGDHRPLLSTLPSLRAIIFGLKNQNPPAVDKFGQFFTPAAIARLNEIEGTTEISGQTEG